MRSLAATCSFSSARSAGSPALIRAAMSASCPWSSTTVLPSSSRRAMPSAFIATRVRNLNRWSSAVGSTSPARNSKTASISSNAFGRSGMFDQVEELVLHLGGHAAEHRVLDAAILSVQVAAALRETADRPLHVAEHLPDVELFERDPAPGQLVVALEVRLDLPHAAEPAPVGAEAPRPNDRPRDVADRIADVRELPVEHRHEAVRVDREVADAKVAVAERRSVRSREPLADPRQPVLDRRMRLADRVELVVEARDRVAARQEVERLDRVDARELLRELHRQPGRRVADDAAADRLAAHALHRKRLVAVDVTEG